MLSLFEIARFASSLVVNATTTAPPLWLALFSAEVSQYGVPIAFS